MPSRSSSSRAAKLRVNAGRLQWKTELLRRKIANKEIIKKLLGNIKRIESFCMKIAHFHIPLKRKLVIRVRKKKECRRPRLLYQARAV